MEVSSRKLLCYIVSIPQSLQRLFACLFVYLPQTGEGTQMFVQASKNNTNKYSRLYSNRLFSTCAWVWGSSGASLYLIHELIISLWCKRNQKENWIEKRRIKKNSLLLPLWYTVCTTKWSARQLSEFPPRLQQCVQKQHQQNSHQYSQNNLDSRHRFHKLLPGCALIVF